MIAFSAFRRPIPAFRLSATRFWATSLLFGDISHHLSFSATHFSFSATRFSATSLHFVRRIGDISHHLSFSATRFSATSPLFAFRRPRGYPKWRDDVAVGTVQNEKYRSMYSYSTGCTRTGKSSPRSTAFSLPVLAPVIARPGHHTKCTKMVHPAPSARCRRSARLLARRDAASAAPHRTRRTGALAFSSWVLTK